MNIKYYIKEYFAIIFYFLVIFNVIIRVIYSKSNKSSNKRSKKKRTKRRNRKGGNAWHVFCRKLWTILKIILCFLTFGLYCPGRGTQYYMLWDPDPGRASSLYEYQDTEEMEKEMYGERKMS